MGFFLSGSENFGTAELYMVSNDFFCGGGAGLWVRSSSTGVFSDFWGVVGREGR
jgi:hypothetical protein